MSRVFTPTPLPDAPVSQEFWNDENTETQRYALSKMNDASSAIESATRTLRDCKQDGARGIETPEFADVRARLTLALQEFYFEIGER